MKIEITDELEAEINVLIAEAKDERKKAEGSHRALTCNGKVIAYYDVLAALFRLKIAAHKRKYPSLLGGI